MFDQIRLHGSSWRVWPLLLVLWLGAFAASARSLLHYEWTAGSMNAAPSQLPASTRTSNHLLSGHPLSGEPSASEGLLIVAVHPLCSCTRATLDELENSAATWHQPFHAVVLVYQAKSSGSASPVFKPAAYLSEAKQALNADLVLDAGGEQAARLGALTSGEILYYSAPNSHGQRRLLFSGGVTAGRGMVGENGGIQALEQAVRKTSAIASSSNQDSQEAHAPVYGCGLAALSPSGGTTK